MKKIKSLMFLVLSLFGFISVGLIDANAQNVPETIKMKSKSSLYYYSETKGTDYISGYNFYRKELTDGTLVYCISNINTSVPGGLTLSLKGEINDAGLDYIIRNGYPNKSFTGDDLKDYYITQSAIWEYYDETRGSNNWNNTSFSSFSTGMKGYVYNLVQSAKSARIYEQVGPSLDIVVVNTTMSLSNDEKYYVSDPISIKMDGNDTYEVKLQNASDGSIIKGTNGDIKNTFKKGEQFIVSIPKTSNTNGSVKVVVSSKNTVVKTYEYTSGRNGYQNISYVGNADLDVSKEITLKYEKVLTKVKISKQDISTKEELPGATLVVKDKNGKIVDKWVSGSTPHYIEGLSAGTYTLTEEIAPNGYVLSSETVTFTVKNDGKVINVLMYNTKYTEVPITDLNMNSITIIGAIALMLLGTGMVIYVKHSH